MKRTFVIERDAGKAYGAGGVDYKATIEVEYADGVTIDAFDLLPLIGVQLIGARWVAHVHEKFEEPVS